MTEDEITEMKVSLLQAMRRNGGAGVRGTIKNFELVKHDQAECFDNLGGSTSASRYRSLCWRGAFAQRGTSAS